MSEASDETSDEEVVSNPTWMLSFSVYGQDLHSIKQKALAEIRRVAQIGQSRDVLDEWQLDITVRAHLTRGSGEIVEWEGDVTGWEKA